ncbi:hypothetical protein [Trujillonella humicola]|uniref:hypothetical protein n=1 Tax=Trujillonella humicola TaxID=3383699 RepID=UPI0039069F76
MRRQTQWALGGVLAGTVLLGAGTTLATFSDRAEVGASAGAASLALDVSPASSGGAPLQVRAQDAGGAQLQVTASGPVPGRLLLTLPADDCRDLPDLALTVTGPGAAAVTATLCELVGGRDLGPLQAGATTLALHVGRAPESEPVPTDATWTGDLRLDLVQDAATAGFSDTRTVRAHLVVPGSPAAVTPPGQGGQPPGTPGNGNPGNGNPGNGNPGNGNPGNGNPGNGNPGNGNPGGGRPR